MGQKLRSSRYWVGLSFKERLDIETVRQAAARLTDSILGLRFQGPGVHLERAIEDVLNVKNYGKVFSRLKKKGGR